MKTSTYIPHGVDYCLKHSFTYKIQQNIYLKNVENYGSICSKIEYNGMLFQMLTEVYEKKNGVSMEDASI